MKNLIKQFLSFNRRQQRGIALLLILLLAAATADWWWPPAQIKKSDDKDLEKQYKAEAAEFLKTRKKSMTTWVNKPNRFASEIYDRSETPTLFKFNPNTIDEAGWKKLGLNNGQVRSIRNYMTSGGKFYKKEDVAKLYCLDSNDYRRLEPFINIPQTTPWPVDSASSTRIKWPVFKTSVPIEINGADSATLTTISGIGPAFASRIIKYRNRLGGFVKKEQLLDVFGMDTIRFHQIDSMVLIDTSLIRKININTATFRELLKHPYLEYYMVKIICQERDKQKGFKSKNDLRALKPMYEELFRKIEPYISTSSETEKQTIAQ
ncbi:MAG TPA: hypothetical protein DCR43_08020 [Bacteroidales bacterium]|nr:MAG: hypothetical protein A2X11_15150 [Bacteroidetes bacterium GWE2_42_24]OFY31679.1 MAG: hypothetical protein A2X09_08895 [Bacteroidetes bacterium GWF2_43_11]HAQ65780.1 hypothetical protein [Bacteroidales bacterium]HBZ67055.1 hypothetical protein [Bacteroidales bacterium]